MQVVQWPGLPLSFNLALNEVLRAFFVNGGNFDLYGIRRVHRCELLYNRDNILAVSDRPKIAILGDRPASENPRRSPGKCEDGSGERVHVLRDSVERVVHIIIPRGKSFPVPPYNLSESDEPGDKMMADEIWGNLIAVFRGSRDKLRERGIVTIKLDDFPQEKSDEQYIVNTGRLLAEVEYVAPSGFSPAALPLV